MFCPNCGTNCNSEHRFCNNCGAALPQVAAQPVIESPAPAAEPVATPVVEPVVESPAPVVEPVATPVVEPVIESTAPAAEPVATPVVEPVIESPAPAVEPVATPVVEPVIESPAPAVEPVATPVVEPVVESPIATYIAPQPAIENYTDTIIPSENCCDKKVGIGGWIVRIVISFLPILVTYFLMFLDSTGMFSSMVSTYSGTKTLAIIFLSLIGAATVFQIVMLLIWALSKKNSSTSRDWARGFIIVAFAVATVAVLASLGMSLFHDAFPKWDSFLMTVSSPYTFFKSIWLVIM